MERQGGNLNITNIHTTHRIPTLWYRSMYYAIHIKVSRDTELYSKTTISAESVCFVLI